ncbi:hypothetical protein Ancab_034121, partial [Ancistrocladus abbreviatus]
MSNSRRTNGDSRQVKTFFMANIPGGCKYEILWSIFRSIGRTVDVCIPRKHGKDGRQFIFIRANIAKHQRVSRSNEVQLATENRVDFEKQITTNIFRQNRRVLWTDSSNPAISSSKMGVRKTNVEEVKSMPDKCSLGLQPTGSKMKTKANLVFDYDNECHWLDNITQGGEESNSLKLASDQSLSVIDRGICLSPLEAVSLLNDELKLLANVESGSLNKLFDSDLGRGEFHDDWSHTDSSIAIRPCIPAYLANMGDGTTISSLGTSEGSGDGSRSLRKVPKERENSRKVKKKTLELIKEDLISTSEGIDLSMALTMDSQIANVNKRVAVMREERKVEKIWDFLTQLGIINEKKDEFLVDKIEELEKNEVNSFPEGLKGWLSNGFRKIIGDRSSMWFWRDRWLEEGRLGDLYRRLFNLAVEKDYSIRDQACVDSPGKAKYMEMEALQMWGVYGEK